MMNLIKEQYPIAKPFYESNMQRSLKIRELMGGMLSNQNKFVVTSYFKSKFYRDLCDTGTLQRKLDTMKQVREMA